MTNDALQRLREADPAADTPALAPDRAATVLHRAMHRTELPAAEGRRNGRRLAAGAAAAVIAAAGGAGVATATGLRPTAFTDTYSYFLDEPLAGQSGIDPSNAERLATTPGPDGTTFSVFVARGENTYVCATSVIEPTPVNDPGPISFIGGPGACQTATENNPYDYPFGEAGNSYVAEHNVFWVDVPMGEAVRAEVRTTMGQTIPMIPAVGYFWGWAPNEVDPARFPTLTGYAADGSVLKSSKISGIPPYTPEELDRS